MKAPNHHANGKSLARYYDQRTRVAMAEMAKNLGLDVASFSTDDTRLWAAIQEAVAGGVKTPSDNIDGDPFAIFVTGRCTNDHGGQGHHEQTAVIKTGERVDQAAGEDRIAYLKAQDSVNTCGACGGKITTWSADNTRMSTFAAKQKARTDL